MDLTIAEIAQACQGRLVLSGETKSDISVTSVELDSRKAVQGGVFLATPGERVDGHRFVASAFEQGVVLAVVSKTPEQFEQETGCSSAGWGSYLLVEDVFLALRQIAAYYRQKLPVKVVGITGSAGKTSTKELTASVLSQKYEVLKTEGNLNNEVGVPLTLLRIRPRHQVAVVEMGISDFGEMHRLSWMAKPDICVITNIGQSHLDNLKTRDGILRAKSEIFDYLAQDGEVCLNGEDDKLSGLGEVKGRRPRFFGLGGTPGQEVYAREVKGKGLSGSDVLLQIGQETVSVRVPLPGVHMVINAAAAACVGKVLGLTPKQIAAGIEKTAPVSGRNRLVQLSEYTVIDDCYNANPASMRAAIDLLAMADTEKVAILGDMFGLGEENVRALHEQVGAYAAEKAIDRIVCVGEQSQYLFQEACRRAEGKCSITHFPTLDGLLEALKDEREAYVPQGCTVLVKASHAMGFERVVERLAGGHEKNSFFNSK